MTEYANLMEGKPDCFALAKQLVVDHAPCLTCHHKNSCSSALDSVCTEVELGRLTAPTGWGG